jgi:hypothetical protein
MIGARCAASELLGKFLGMWKDKVGLLVVT